MPEMAHAGEHHGKPGLVGRFDHLGVAHGSAWLNHGGSAGFRDCLQSVREGEEGIRRRHRSFGQPRLEAGGLRRLLALPCRHARRVDS